MAITKSKTFTREDYAQAAMEYQSGLTLENLMEATPQGKQREITLESLALVKGRRPEVQVFNELLVQYPQASTGKLDQVVPDNMIVVSKEPILAEGSFDVTLEPASPFCMLEYVSPHTWRKDYEDNMVKYERDLKVPYYLRFDPQHQDLALFRHNKRKFVAVMPNKQGRLALPELDLEVGLLDGWMRFWYQGELLPLPADLQRELDQIRHQLAQTTQQLTKKTKHLAETTQQLAETSQHLAEKTQQLAETTQQLDKERLTRQAAEDEIARLKAQLAQTRRPKANGG